MDARQARAKRRREAAAARIAAKRAAAAAKGTPLGVVYFPVDKDPRDR